MWSFKNEVSQVFTYLEANHAVDITGTVFIYAPTKEWMPTAYELRPNSRVVHADDDLIACNPTPLLKSASDVGACYSMKREWSVAANWRDLCSSVNLEYATHKTPP